MNKPRTITQRVEALRQRRREAGMVRLEVYAHPDDHGQVKAVVAKLARKRTTKEKKA